MTRAPQQRRLKTRLRLLEVAREIVATHGYDGLRVEEVVDRAGTAKGTLFAHFKDKDGLLAAIIGEHVVAHLDQLESHTCPQSIAEFCTRLAPLMTYVAEDRVIFDLLLRYSGSTGELVDETITQFFLRQVDILSVWLDQMQRAGQVRGDQPPLMLAEGVQAFESHVLGLWFCMDHADEETPAAALAPFLQAWLKAPT